MKSEPLVVPQGVRRLAAIMFTDMVGYTALGQRDESLSLALVEEQRRLVRPILARHNGREVKTIGDAFLVEFPNALEAVRCAYDIQRATREFNFSVPEERRIHLRVGVHLGDVVESDGDISGDAVNVASRIEPLAENGGVCLSRQVHESVRGKFELKMESLGERDLKNVEVPMEVFRVVLPWSTGEDMEEGLNKTRVAVLPFRNMSPDPGDEYFAEGMTEEIISTVSKIRELAVISRTSVMKYRDPGVPILQIGRELKVGSVVEGSVRKAGNKVRITAQLIDVESDRHLWSQNYDRELTDVFAIQGDIAEKVADSLKVQLVPVEKEDIKKQSTMNPEAYSLYLKGRYFWNERTQEGTMKALTCFEQASRLDPNFAMAFSGMADAYNILSDYGWMAPGQALPLAKEFALKALAIDDALAEAHASLGLVLSNYTLNLEESEKELKRAISLKPNYAPAYHWYAVLLFYMRRYEEAFQAEEHAIELDPLSRLYNMAKANQTLVRGDYEMAFQRYAELIEMYPDFSAIRYWRSIGYALAGKYPEAVAEAEEYVSNESASWDSIYGKLHLAWVYAVSGKASKAKALLDEAVAYKKAGGSASSVGIGWMMIVLGHKEEGYGWLMKGLDERDPGILYLNGFPWTKEIRADPRWAAIEAKFGFKSAPD